MNPYQAVENHPNHEAEAERQAADKAVPAVKVHGFGSTVFDANNKTILFSRLISRSMHGHVDIFLLYFLAVNEFFGVQRADLFWGIMRQAS